MWDEIKNKIIRNALWILLATSILLVLTPQMSELRMLMMIVFIELVAIALSGLASFVYTKVDFIASRSYVTLGAIFLGVHFLVGLGVVGLYYSI